MSYEEITREIKEALELGPLSLQEDYSSLGYGDGWSNLELSSTSFELGWARIPGGLAAAVGIWSYSWGKKSELSTANRMNWAL